MAHYLPYDFSKIPTTEHPENQIYGPNLSNLIFGPIFQKQAFAVVLQSCCSYNFREFDRKTPVLESFE